MYIRAPIRKCLSLFCILLLVSGLGACASVPISPPNTPSALNPQGPGAAQISSLLGILTVIAISVVVLVTILMFAALLRGRRATNDTPPDSDGDTGRRWLIWGGIILPLILLTIAFGSTVHTLAAITAPQNAPLSMNVTGRQWWWEVNYRDQGITTADEIHIPVGVPVQLVLESGDVIHSFWVPELHGKMDLIPGRVNTIIIQADQAGVYRGECAEYCGLQHAHMGFMVVAQNQADFDQWVAGQQKTAASPQNDTAKRGQQVFLSAGCANCHYIQGLDDSSVDASKIDLGPDLTHLQSRLTIAGATLTNNKGNLAGWVVGAQHVKPGSLMPELNLAPQDLQALLAYLQTLT